MVLIPFITGLLQSPVEFRIQKTEGIWNPPLADAISKFLK
jgi:hypothetical protein